MIWENPVQKTLSIKTSKQRSIFLLLWTSLQIIHGVFGGRCFLRCVHLGFFILRTILGFGVAGNSFTFSPCCGENRVTCVLVLQPRPRAEKISSCVNTTVQHTRAGSNSWSVNSSTFGTLARCVDYSRIREHYFIPLESSHRWSRKNSPLLTPHWAR